MYSVHIVNAEDWVSGHFHNHLISCTVCDINDNGRSTRATQTNKLSVQTVRRMYDYNGL